VTFIPMFFLGHEGMPRQVSSYSAFHGWDTLNVIATVGAFTLFAAFAVFLVNLALSLRAGAAAGADPWDAQALEWAAPSPPPRHNFDSLPPVRSYAPLLDLRQAREAAA
jgi:heme/copper-type cytochrome/quinol oxidase subunit 1